MEKVQTRLSGTRDYVGDEAAALRGARLRLESIFSRYAYGTIDPPILERSSPFLDRSGENIRRRMYIFPDPGGREVCLRPELTIPTCRAFLRNFPAADREVRLSYVGPAFRYDSPTEGRYRQFYQAGVELIGAAHREAADAEVTAVALDSLRSMGLKNLSVVFGDLGILHAFIAGLPVGDRAKARLRRSALRKASRRDLSEPAEHGPATPSNAKMDELASLLSAMEPDKAELLIKEILGLVDVRHVGGRTPEEIIERLTTRIPSQAAEPISREMLDGISSLLAIRGEPDAVAERVRVLFADFNIPSVEPILEQCERRNGMINAYHGEGFEQAFDVGLHRGLEYYTGYVFEIYAKDAPDIGHLCGGGRYDNLLEALGASTSVPAVGAAIGIDRALLARDKAKAPPWTAASGPDALVVAAGNVAPEECIRVSVALRAAGWSVETETSGRRPKSVIRDAIKRNIPNVVFVGENEIRDGVVLIKQLDDHREQPVALADLARYVANAGRLKSATQ